MRSLNDINNTKILLIINDDLIHTGLDNVVFEIMSKRFLGFQSLETGVVTLVLLTEFFVSLNSEVILILGSPLGAIHLKLSLHYLFL